VAAAACSGGAPVQRGFNSRQLVAIRDSTIWLTGWVGNQWIYSTSTNQTQVATNFWALDLDSGAVQDLGSNFPMVTPPAPPPGRYTCGSTAATGPALTITDTQTGEMVTLDGLVAGLPLCPSDDDPSIRVWRRNTDGTYSYWIGPFDALTEVPLSMTVSRFLFFFVDSTGTPTAMFVFAAPLGQPDAVGVYSIDLATYAFTEMVPPAPVATAWATGTTPAGPLDSTTIDPQMSFRFLGSGRFVYWRTMSDGQDTMFAGIDPSAPTELALLRPPPSTPLSTMTALGTDGFTYAPPLWQYADPADQSTHLVSWNDRSRQLVGCLSPFSGQVSAHLDPTHDWLGLNLQSDLLLGQVKAGPLILIGPGSCTTLATADVTSFGFSPDGTASAWLVQPPSGDATLWTAGPDGTGQRALGTGAIDSANDPPHFVSGSELELNMGGDLAWINVHDDPVHMNYIAERTFGSSIDFGDWLVTGYDVSGQDATGTLALINRTKGDKDKSVISPEVSLYISGSASNALGMASVVVQGTTPDPSLPLDKGGMAPMRVVYLVRGRNPSPQDGIWIATITSDDLH
jgi:hypothetical protein